MHPRPPLYSPPRWAEKLLLFFLREELQEEVQGDLEERFYAMLETHSAWQAKKHYIYQVFFYLRPFAIRFPLFNHLYPIAMYRNYFKIAWRNLRRNKVYSAIKIGGLALGVAACLLIGLYLQDELSYDRQYPGGDRIYRLVNEFHDPEGLNKWTSFPPPIGHVLTHDFPDIEQVGRLVHHRFFNAGANQIRSAEENKSYYEEGFAYADPELLDMLDIPMIYGDAASALNQAQRIVLSESKAEKYFPNENPIGKTIILNEDKENPYSIGGVMEDFPSNTHLQVDFFLTLEGAEFWPGEQSSWCCSNYKSYVKLKTSADPEEVEEKLQRISSQYFVPYFRKRGDKMAGEYEKYHRISLQPIHDIHLYSAGIYESRAQHDIRYVWFFGVIALLILLLACFNFINLSTAKSANRAKEVGLRKVIGSQRKNLIRQFITESLVFSTIAVGIGLLLVKIGLPYFNESAGKEISFPLAEWWLLPFVLGITIIVGLLSGIYPAFYLSKFQPIQVLKGELSKGSKGSRLQGVLVVFQFTVSILLIVCALIVNKQMQFILNKNLGFNKDQVLIIEGTSTMEANRESFVNELKKLSYIHQVSTSSFLPVNNTNRDNRQWWKEGRRELDRSVDGQLWRVDDQYISTLEMNVLSGRNFSPAMATDSQAVVINQTMARKFGFENPIGQRITNGFDPTFHVIGVVEDFHFESVKGDILPLALVLEENGDFTLAKVDAHDMERTLLTISQIWETFMPQQAFRYSFLDDRYATMYEDVSRMRQLFTVFAVLAIFIACLGLFALSAYMAEQRRKEISIRKVLGATFSQVMTLLTTRFLKLVCISLLLAIPLGYLLMQEWLAGFSYRIPMSWEVFALSGFLIFAIAIATISFESIRAARKDPAVTLQKD